MKKNVIILTHGWTGSSVFTALIAQAGYWYGEKTFQKVDYDTHENLELIQLNKKMLQELEFEGDHEHEFSHDEIIRLEKKAEKLDFSPYREFVERCDQNQPWIWKDPRLTWTIRIWAKMLNLENIAFIILTRDDEQAWISSNLRRHIQSRRFTSAYNKGITDSLKEFLRLHQIEYVELEFEDLLLRPEVTIGELNKYLGISLTMEDVKKVYNGPLYRKSKGFKDKVKAMAIYLKNYRERYR